MKKRNLIFAMLLTVMSTASFATEGEKGKADASPKIEVTFNDSDVFNVRFLGNRNIMTTINIWDDKNSLVFTETIKKINAFVRPYNFSRMPHGRYTLEIRDGNTVKREVIYHGIQPTVDIPADMNVIKFAPISQDDHKYRLTIIKSGKSVANIDIYNDNEEIIYSATELINGSFCKLYNLKNLDKGTTIKVSINGVVTEYKY